MLEYFRASGIDHDVVQLPVNIVARTSYILRSSQYDAVLLQKKPLNFLDAGLLRKCASRIIYDFDDAVMFAPDIPAQVDSKRLKAFARTANLADVVIAGNNYLADQARLFNSRVYVVPTGLDISSYGAGQTEQKNGHIRLVWIGSAATLQYLESIRSCFDAIGRDYPNVVLRVISDKFISCGEMRVEKCKWTEQDHVRQLCESDIGIAPLADNSYSRGKCGFKILQYQAAGVPVIASPVGVNGELVSNGVSGFHARNEGEWIEGMRELIKDRGLRERMGAAGRQSAMNLDIKKIATTLVDIIRSCAGRK